MAELSSEFKSWECPKCGFKTRKTWGNHHSCANKSCDWTELRTEETALFNKPPDLPPVFPEGSANNIADDGPPHLGAGVTVIRNNVVINCDQDKFSPPKE